jgi:hypothetical protein
MFLDRLNEVLLPKKSFIQDPINLFSLGTSIIINIIHWAILGSNIKPNQGNILLHYNVVTGADLINKSIYIYWLPALALILFFINYFIASWIYKKEKLAAYFINIGTIPVQLIFLVATLVLISING